jgi:hypothetical protein
MQLLPIHLTIALLALGCGHGRAQNDAADPASAKPAPSAPSGEASDGYWEKLVMHPFRDAQGTVIAEMPFPASWKVTANARQGEPTIVGPNHIKVIDFPPQSFIHTNDPQMLRIYQNSGQPLRALPETGQLIQQDLVPWAAGQGLEFVKHYELPEVARIDHWYHDQLYKAMPTEIRAVAIGTEWKHTATGKPFFLVVRLTIREGQTLRHWSYFSNGLQAEKAHFNKARKQFLFGLANARYRLEPIMAYNKAEAERVGKSWAEHNARMARNWANFEASQRAFVNRSNAAHDGLMKNWQDRNAASDRSHERFVDTITERTKMSDPSTGQQYKVDSGSSHYWMNRDGQYFGTDNVNYDPNRDQEMNRQNWQKLDPVE